MLNNVDKRSNFNYVSIIFYLYIAYFTTSQIIAQVLIENLKNLNSKLKKIQTG